MILFSAIVILAERRCVMRKLEIKDPEIIQIAVQQEILRSEESRYDHRLHGILLVCSGLSCPEVAKLFGHGPRTIQYWVRRFEESGFAGLEESPRQGRPSVIDEHILREIDIDLRRSPREFGYSQNLWDGKLLGHHLSQYYGVQLGERQCRRLFHKLGFRRRKPRPLIAKADKEAQQRYKKT
jgi:transposase